MKEPALALSVAMAEQKKNFQKRTRFFGRAHPPGVNIFPPGHVNRSGCHERPGNQSGGSMRAAVCYARQENPGLLRLSLIPRKTGLCLSGTFKTAMAHRATMLRRQNLRPEQIALPAV